MRVRSIRLRLTLWYSSLLTLTLIVLAAVTYGLLHYSLSSDLDASLHSVAQALGKRTREERSSLFRSDIDEIFQRFFGFSPLERYFEMFVPPERNHRLDPGPQSRNLPLSTQALTNASRGRPTFETVEGAGGYPIRMLTLPVVDRGRVTRLIQVGLSLKNMHESLRRFLLIMLAVLPLGVLLAGGGGWLLARRAFRPVDQMTQTAKRISAEHLAQRLEETGTGDELDNLAHTLNDMLGRLDASFTQIRQFSADASHELQTPLTILKGEIEVALRSTRNPKEYQRVLKSALEEINRIAQLVDGLLLLARADAGVLKMDKKPVDLAVLVRQIHEQARILADARSVQLHLGPIEPAVIPGDEDRLRRLLLNLLDNAIKYTLPGGRVKLTLKRGHEGAAIRVSDTGIGLSSQDKEAIFHPFYRSSQARSGTERGVGLGMSIARSIAEAHGGTIGVESEPSKGSTFTVFLPQGA